MGEPGEHTPRQVLEAWFDAHGRGDLAAAEALMAPGAPVDDGDQVVHGFDGLMAWYAERRQRRPDLHYEVLDVLDGRTHVAAVLAMSQGERRWLQTALYRVESGRIVAVEVFEHEPPER